MDHFTFICCAIIVLKRPKLNVKEAGNGHFNKKEVYFWATIIFLRLCATSRLTILRLTNCFYLGNTDSSQRYGTIYRSYIIIKLLKFSISILDYLIASPHKFIHQFFTSPPPCCQLIWILYNFFRSVITYKVILLKRFTYGALTVRQDWAIYWTLGNFLKPLATLNFAQISHILRQYLKNVKINHFSCEIIFGQLLLTFGDFVLVTPYIPASLLG